MTPGQMLGGPPQGMNMQSAGMSNPRAPEPHEMAEHERDQWMQQMQRRLDEALKTLAMTQKQRAATNENFERQEHAISQVIDSCRAALGDAGEKAMADFPAESEGYR